MILAGKRHTETERLMAGTILEFRIPVNRDVPGNSGLNPPARSASLTVEDSDISKIETRRGYPKNTPRSRQTRKFRYKSERAR
jgi:hypothetical protein